MSALNQHPMASNMISFEAFLPISSHTKVEYHIQRNIFNQGFLIHKPQVPNKVSTYHKPQIQTNQKYLPVIENEVICLPKSEKQAPNGRKIK